MKSPSLDAELNIRSLVDELAAQAAAPQSAYCSSPAERIDAWGTLLPSEML